MLQFVLKALFGSKYERDLKRITPYVERINALEPEIQNLSDAELAAKTPAFKERIANGEKLISILPEAFAVLRETSLRVLKMRHFDVQLMGAMALNEGKIAEMKTGEGKTLTATLAVYLNALKRVVQSYDDVIEGLTLGLTKPINWLETQEYLKKSEISTLVEVYPRPYLSKFTSFPTYNVSEFYHLTL